MIKRWSQKVKKTVKMDQRGLKKGQKGSKQHVADPILLVISYVLTIFYPNDDDPTYDDPNLGAVG